MRGLPDFLSGDRRLGWTDDAASRSRQEPLGSTGLADESARVRRCWDDRTVDMAEPENTALSPACPSTVAEHDGLALCHWTRSGFSALVEAGADPVIRRWMPRMPSPYGPAEANWFLSQTGRWWRDGSRYELAVTVHGSVVGLCGFTIEDPAVRTGYVGYWILERHRGQGLAAIALRLMTRWAMESGVVDTLVCRVAPNNSASRLTAERAGYLVSERSEVVHGRSVLLLIAEQDDVLDRHP